ncbi:Synaptotagmin-C [Orchesella cincta]|uniref:Synaptotagmin-C n=1 Tax=Orchesella cincta TaxID=48709 RepID=A0A1D2MR29_ORCCI|nr:Synaptotagmin-C [Orchesella cincta]
MGVPQTSSHVQKTVEPSYNSLNAYYNSYYPSLNLTTTTPTVISISSDPDSSPASSTSSSDSSILSEYLLNGLNDSFLQKYSRELTIAASSFSVLILLLIGACIFCIIRALRRDNHHDDESFNSNSTKKGDAEHYPTDSSYCASEGSAAGYHNGTKKQQSIISKLFSKHNGNSARILAEHRNIITPDKNIPFVVPTITMTCQPGESSKSSIVAQSPSSTFEPQPSTSKAAHHQALLLAQQFFPQLEQPEASDSCPLIAFTLFYELSSQILSVRLLEGRNFPEKVNHTVAVKIYPGRSGKQHTKEFKTRSPVYNVEFCYHVRKTSLHTKVLKLRAVIPGSPKRIIGYVNVALNELQGFDATDVTEDLNTLQLWRRVELPSEIGEGVRLQVSLKWSPEPSPGLLTMKVIEAAGLHENRECDYTSSYVKVTLQEQGRNIKTRKTQLVRWGSVPVFDDVFVLTIPQELLSQISFLLVVIARGRLGSKAVLGKISIGPVPYSNPPQGTGKSSGTEFWEDMCHQPDSEVVRWLHLVP